MLQFIFREIVEDKVVHETIGHKHDIFNTATLGSFLNILIQDARIALVGHNSLDLLKVLSQISLPRFLQAKVVLCDNALNIYIIGASKFIGDLFISNIY